MNQRLLVTSGLVLVLGVSGYYGYRFYRSRSSDQSPTPSAPPANQ